MAVKVPVPMFRVNAANGLVTVLYVVAILGAAKLVALSHPGNKVAQAWLTLF